MLTVKKDKNGNITITGNPEIMGFLLIPARGLAFSMWQATLSGGEITPLTMLSDMYGERYTAIADAMRKIDELTAGEWEKKGFLTSEQATSENGGGTAKESSAADAPSD